MRTRPNVVEPIGAPEATDEELVLRARSGDRWACEVIFRRHVGAVGATVVRLLGTREGAEDVLQDTFLQAFAELDRLRSASALRPWLLRIAVNKLHRLFRRRKLLRVLGLASEVPEASLMNIVANAPGPDIRAELALIDRVLAGLPNQERIAWMLRYVEGEELADVAQILGCSLATAKRRIRAADQALEAHIDVQGGGSAT